MRIGIDAHVLGKKLGGVERFVERVVALTPDLRPQDQFVVFVSRRAAPRFANDARPNVHFVTLPVSDPILQRSLVLPWLAYRHRLDVLFVQRVAPWLVGRCQILLAVHDLIPINHPEKYSGLRDRLVRWLTPGSVRRAALIVCPTQCICDEVGRVYLEARAPKLPFYNGVDREMFLRARLSASSAARERYGLDRPYLFSSGAVEPRKNLETIVEALAQLDEPSRPLLALCGPLRDQGYFSRVLAQAAELGVDMRHLGFVPDEDLADLYRDARFCVTASRDEGFSLPPLEALACDALTLVSDIPAHRELYEGAATFFPPDRADLLAGLLRYPESLEEGQATQVTIREDILNRLSWNATARRMADAFGRLAPDAA